MNEGEPGGDPSSNDLPEAAEFKPARFPCEHDLPAGDSSQLEDARLAIRQEFRDCSKWKRLRCRKVSVFAERDRGVIHVVHVGASVEFDWTWEGAKAFRPQSFADEGLFGAYDEESAYEEEALWSGEIVEVDERNGCLFVSLDDPERAPTVGSFFVRPFEFLSVLHAVYNEAGFDEIRGELPRRLNAAAGDVHPLAAASGRGGLPQLSEWWRHSWSVLWGPPGTGKTYTTGQQIARTLQDGEERILVVSTTNRATDAVALSIGRAAARFCPEELASDTLLRIGKGASYKTFVNEGLDAMLRGTESELLSRIDGLAQQLPLFDSWEDKALTRKQIGELKASGDDQSRRIFIDPEKRVVVSTAFKAMSFLRDGLVRKMLEEGEAPFTTIFIDEAGLISRTAVAALSLLAARRVVLVGDSKQLAPISRISRILPTKQQKWLASSGRQPPRRHRIDAPGRPRVDRAATDAPGRLQGRVRLSIRRDPVDGCRAGRAGVGAHAVPRRLLASHLVCARRRRRRTGVDPREPRGGQQELGPRDYCRRPAQVLLRHRRADFARAVRLAVQGPGSRNLEAACPLGG